MSSPHPASSAPRLGQIDALRGVAASLVVLFHYSTRYQQLFGHVSPPAFSVPWGFYGVNLFFMISGFVIFMTLDRTRRPMDFIVSRLSRLYPAYWTALALTFVLLQLLPLPGKSIQLRDALLNGLMFHGLFNVPHVDNVYWTLEVELLFYAWALLVFRCGLLQRVHRLLWLLLAARLAYFTAHAAFGVDLPWVIYRLLILPYIAWFACGIMVFRLALRPLTPQRDVFTLGAAIAVLGVVDGAGVAALAVVLTATLYLAATQRLKLLDAGVFLWLGAISYTLYLLHENIGWAVIRQLEASGMGANGAVAVTIAAVLASASVLTYRVERPAMRWIRARYRSGHRAS